MAAADIPPGGRPVATVDPGALVEKLRSLVTGLVAEAMTTHPQPLLQQRGSASSVASQDTALRELHQQPLQPPSTFAPTTQGQGLPMPPQQLPRPSTLAPGQPGQGMLVWVPAAASGLQPDGRGPDNSWRSAVANTTFAAPSPCIQIIVQPLPSGPLGPQPGYAVASPAVPVMAATSAAVTTAAAGPGADALPDLQLPPDQQLQGRLSALASAATLPVLPMGDSGRRGAVPLSAGMGSGHGVGIGHQDCGVPAVLELNVDGTAVFVDRAVLETQAQDSPLYDLVIRRYHSLPLDAQGRPYLSYDPRVFKTLLSFIKERWLFGVAAPSRDWPHVVRSLGVSPLYFEQVASHFGLPEVVASRPVPTEVALPSTTSASAAASESSAFILRSLSPPPQQPGSTPTAAAAAQQRGHEEFPLGPRSGEALSDGALTSGAGSAQRVGLETVVSAGFSADQSREAAGGPPHAPGARKATSEQVAASDGGGGAAVPSAMGAQEAGWTQEDAAASRQGDQRASHVRCHEVADGSPVFVSTQPVPQSERTPGPPRPGMGADCAEDATAAVSPSPSPRSLRIPPPPSKPGAGLERLRSGEAAIAVGSGSSTATGADAGASQVAVLSSNVRPLQQDSAAGGQNGGGLPRATAPEPYRMPSLYTLLAVRQMADEGAD